MQFGGKRNEVTTCNNGVEECFEATMVGSQDAEFQTKGCAIYSDICGAYRNGSGQFAWEVVSCTTFIPEGTSRFFVNFSSE